MVMQFDEAMQFAAGQSPNRVMNQFYEYSEFQGCLVNLLIDISLFSKKL
jgi:hypothetical protein